MKVASKDRRGIEPQRQRDTEKTRREQQKKRTVEELRTGAFMIPSVFSVSLCLCGSFLPLLPRFPCINRRSILAAGVDGIERQRAGRYDIGDTSGFPDLAGHCVGPSPVQGVAGAVGIEHHYQVLVT